MTSNELGKQLLQSSKLGDVDDVKLLMSNGAPFSTDWLGVSPLHFAAEHGHIETAEVLLRSAINRDIRSKVDRTPMHVAAQFGHDGIISLLLSYGADIEARDMLQMTPLHWAVEKCKADVVLTLLQHGADTNVLNKFDLTPMMIAVSHDSTDVIELLKTVVPIRSLCKQDPIENAAFPTKSSRPSTYKKKPKGRPPRAHLVFDEFGHIEENQALQIIDESALTICNQFGEPINEHGESIDMPSNYIIEEVNVDNLDMNREIKTEPITVYHSELQCHLLN